ncbi:hypothetical protein HHK36_029725 [Tetracentron sinense]|uniref:Cytochrome P450 n=1 Tax=Tetracentron sinense TaxID=13715 RepID=A0A835D213_TETSI|nr:hypothetical protein HHK36_029725 [Tetracentron sinense]
MLTFLWYFKILRRPEDFIKSKQDRYGDGVGMYRTHLFGSPSIITCSPAINKLILKSDELFPISWPSGGELFGRNCLVTVHGEPHARLRSYVSKAINQPEPLKRIALLLQPHIVSSLRSWAEKGTVRTLDEVKKVTFTNIGKLFVSFEPGPVLDKLDHYFEGLLKGLRAQPLNFPGTAYHHALQCRKKLLEIFRTELEIRKHNGNGSEERNDLMNGLMHMKDEEGKQLGDDEVLDNIIGLIVGGYKSTSLALMWAIYYLAKFPDVLRKLREENMAVCKNKKADFINIENISQMKYTNKVVEETLRMANISPFFFRLVNKDFDYQGYRIPKNWTVIVWARNLHIDPKYFEDPMVFNPDRWNEPPKPGTFQVFGGGTRICAGNMLVRIQIAILLHHLAIGYKWELINPDAKITYLPHPAPEDRVQIAFMKEVKPALIPSTGKSSSQNEKVVQDLSDKIEPKKKENNSENKQVTSNKDEKPQNTLEVSKTMPVLRYVPCSKRKGGQSPFIGCTNTDLKALNGLTFPVTKLISSTISKPPLKGFVRPSQGPEIEHGSLPTERTEEGFDPNAYKLLAKAGYDYKDPPLLGKLSCETTGENVHGLNRTQQKLKGKGYAVKSFKDGVGYSPPPPVRISSRKANAQYITTQSVDEDCVPVAKTSVFDRISRPTSRVSVFKRLGTQVDTNTNGIITKSNDLRHSQRIRSSKKIKKDNKQADALANLASTLALPKQGSITVPVCQRRVITSILPEKVEGANSISVFEVEKEDWRDPLIAFLQHGKLPDDLKHRTEIRRRAPRSKCSVAAH